MMPRFFAPELISGAETVTLPAEEARHLTRVSRLVKGDAIKVFDGQGNEFLAHVDEISNDKVVVKPVSRTQAAEELSVKLTLAQALLKGKKLDGVIRDAVMLGVTAVQPLLTVRGNIPASVRLHKYPFDRWKRIAISSTKQRRRAVIPEVKPAIDYERFLACDRSALRVILVEPGPWSQTIEHVSVLRTRSKPRSATVVIGAEGGWTTGGNCSSECTWLCTVNAW